MVTGDVILPLVWQSVFDSVTDDLSIKGHDDPRSEFASWWWSQKSITIFTQWQLCPPETLPMTSHKNPKSLQYGLNFRTTEPTTQGHDVIPNITREICRSRLKNVVLHAFACVLMPSSLQKRFLYWEQLGGQETNTLHWFLVWFLSESNGKVW